MTEPTKMGGAAGVVVIGGGQAAGRLAEALRQSGFADPITLIGEERHLPYERPSLSKELLGSGSESDITWVQQQSFYVDYNIDARLGLRAIAIDRERRVVTLADGEQLGYATLVFATGARPRRLPVPASIEEHCMTLRTIDDSLAIHRRLKPMAEVVIVGAGFIGLEVASAAVLRGCRVTVLDAAPLPMARCVPDEVGAYYLALHRSKSVAMRMGVGVEAIVAAAGKPAVILKDGEQIAADLIVMGIGVVPNSELASAAGLGVDNGIIVDAECRTNDPVIFAIGDVASRYQPGLGRHVRPESWFNAQSEAISVARTIAGVPNDGIGVPWFWSDQQGHNLQIYGFPSSLDEMVARGELGESPAIRFYIRDGRISAAVGVDAGRDIRIAREMIAAGVKPSPSALSDPELKLADVWRQLKQEGVGRQSAPAPTS